MMRIRGVLVTMLVQMNPAKYEGFVTYDKNGNPLLCVMMLQECVGKQESKRESIIFSTRRIYQSGPMENRRREATRSQIAQETDQNNAKPKYQIEHV